MKNMPVTASGILYVVATPIGNLGDISNRALYTLNSVDFILAEDTRHSLHLMQSLGIKKPLHALHEHNEIAKSTEIIQSLQEGKNIALISDAGTPLICDPGFFLVRLAREQAIRVIPIAGPCALIAALSVAGIPPDSFTFLGFLPAKSSLRVARLQDIKTAEHTQIMYESTHRIINCIEDIIDVFGMDYPMMLAKEISKTFEHFISAPVKEIHQWLLSDKNHVKGEFVLIIPSSPKKQMTTDDEDTLLLTALLEELPLKQAVKIASKLSTSSKNNLYKQALLLTHH